jgi:hypothetical protein
MAFLEGEEMKRGILQYGGVGAKELFNRRGGGHAIA